MLTTKHLYKIEDVLNEYSDELGTSLINLVGVVIGVIECALLTLYSVSLVVIIQVVFGILYESW